MLIAGWPVGWHVEAHNALVPYKPGVRLRRRAISLL